MRAPRPAPLAPRRTSARASTLAIALVLATGLAMAGPASAQASTGHATLALELQPDGDEILVLELEGLRRLTQYQGICLPEGALETRVHDGVGDVPYEAREENGRRVLSFLAREERITINMARPGPDDADHPLYVGSVNFCVPSGNSVSVRVAVPETHTLFFLGSGGTLASAREGTVENDGPLHAYYAYEAPLDARRNLEILDEGPFRVLVQPAYAAQAREVARLATAPLADALAEAGLDLPFDTLRVLYARETPHAWEAGHYNGHGYVEAKESSLVDEPTEGYPHNAVKILVHEAFHAASFPHGKGDVEDDLAWWLEGTARHAERAVDRAYPNASHHCERGSTQVRCYNFDDRITRTNLSRGYEPAFTFDLRWEPSHPQGEETRRFYYAYSEFVVGAWIQQNGERRYQETWDRLLAAFDEGKGCPCGKGWLLDALGDSDLFRPWNDLRASDPDGFEARVRPFVQDEEGFQRLLESQASPFPGLEVPTPAGLAPAGLALAAGLLVALSAARRPRG